MYCLLSTECILICLFWAHAVAVGLAGTHALPHLLGPFDGLAAPLNLRTPHMGFRRGALG